MRILRIAAVMAAAVMVSWPVAAQKFLWNVDFDFRFDNKEYAGMVNDVSVTNFAVRLTPQVGIGWKNGNAIMAGVDVMNDFGAGTRLVDEMVLYYRYRDDRFGAFLGRFARRNLIGNYSYAFFSDYLSWYDNNIDGLAGQYVGRRGYVELVLDWNGMVRGDMREKFSIFSAGNIDCGAFYAGYNARMYHFAGSETVRGVVDNILLYPYVGIDFTHYLPSFQQMSLRAGWLQSLQNDRRYIGKFVSPGGVQLELHLERWGFGIYNTLYLGNNLMPYYSGTIDGQPSYSSELYFGEPFYKTDKGIYNRLEIYYRHRFKSNIALQVSSVHHYDGDAWGWQQKFQIDIYLFEGMFKCRK